ncbi:MAG: ABC transporter ATP-binding protein [Bacteroidia bacterium]|nr:ABC transporter ATP-binding protein [Bacteroidia bacterium]
MKQFLRILAYIKNYKGYAALNVLFNILSVIFSVVSLTMVIPFLNLLFEMQELTTEAPPLGFSAESIIANFYLILSDIIRDEGRMNALIFICMLVVGMFLLKNLFKYLALYFMAPLRNGVIRDLRNDIQKKMLRLPLSYFSEKRKGDLMVRITNDAQEIEWSIMSSIEVVFRDPITVIAFLIVLVTMSPQLTLFIFLLLPIAGLLVARIARSLRKSSMIGQEKLAEVLNQVEESLGGMRIIKAFAAEVFSMKKFSELNDSYTRTVIKVYRKRVLSSPLSEFLGACVLVILMFYGGRLVLADNATMAPATFIGFIAVFSQIIPPVRAFSSAYYNIQKGIASAQRITSVLDEDLKIHDPENPVALTEFKNSIEYSDVTFAYEEKNVLQNVNLKIEKGKTLALVGASGGGKSTLADLLPRFYDVQGGKILIDGVSIKDVRVSDLRKLMGIVTQQSILFNDTIFNNIAFGMENPKEEDVINAAKIANAHEFISELANGYHTNIGEGGNKLSGGQKQRISIARAVMKNPPILILDEATSSLDTESEKLVQDALINLMKNRTSLVIAHRLSTIQHADEIVVIEAGKIVERGTHAELISGDGVYRKLSQLQSF